MHYRMKATTLLAKITKDLNGCWNHPAKRRMSRLAYEAFNGCTLPDGYYVCHKCDNPKCINPEHLFLSTPLGNVRDMIRKGRGAKGSRSGAAKLTESKVLAIRLFAQKESNIRAIADKFCLPYSAVYRVIKGKTWKHVAGAAAL